MAKPNQRTTAAACPCGSGEPYSRCCRPFHLRLAEPPTAEQLMRSRYSAYAKGLDAYLLHSWDPAHRPATIELDPRHRWTGLTIIATSGGAPDDTAGTVEFVAAFEIERQHRVAGEGGQAHDAFGAAGRAAVDFSLARGDGGGVAAAIGVAAARALRLRQQRVDALGQCVGGAHRAIMR